MLELELGQCAAATGERLFAQQAVALGEQFAVVGIGAQLSQAGLVALGQYGGDAATHSEQIMLELAALYALLCSLAAARGELALEVIALAAYHLEFALQQA